MTQGVRDSQDTTLRLSSPAPMFFTEAPPKASYFLMTIINLIKKPILIKKACNLLGVQSHPEGKEYFKACALVPSTQETGFNAVAAVVQAHGSSELRQMGELEVCPLYKDTTWYHVRGQK